MMKKLKFELTPEEVRLIGYWRESCHNYNSYCPLKNLPEGIPFCHKVTDKLREIIDSWAKEKQA